MMHSAFHTRKTKIKKSKKSINRFESIHNHCAVVEGISGFDGRRGTPLSSASSPRTPTSGGSLKIGRRSHERSKSPFRSFRWKRGSSKATDSDDEEGNKFIFHTHHSSLITIAIHSNQSNQINFYIELFSIIRYITQYYYTLRTSHSAHKA